MVESQGSIAESVFMAEERLQTCKHCGLPLPRGKYKLFDSSKFCCAGCQTVYNLINDCGLSGFYQHRDSLGATLKPVRERNTRFEHFDDSLWREENVELKGEVSRLSFSLENIHCAACVWLLERLPGVCEGVLRAEPSLADSTIQIEFEPHKTSPGMIASAIYSFGYIPHTFDRNSEGQVRHAERTALLRIGVAGFSAGNTMLLAIAMYQGQYTGIDFGFKYVFQWTSFLLTLPVLLYCAVPFYRTALGGLRAGIIHVDLPISLGVVVGFIASVLSSIQESADVYYDSVCALVFFLLVGRWIQQRLVLRAKKIVGQFQYLPTEVEIEVDGGTKQVLLGRVRLGDVVRVGRNQIIPCDGSVIGNVALVNNSHLTGEHRPISVDVGETVFAGGKCLSKTLRLKVGAIGSDSRIGSVIQNVQTIGASKLPFRELTQRLTAYFMSFILFGCLLIVVLCWPAGFSVIAERIVAFLVISCPCALGLSAPLAAGMAMARAYEQGIYVKSADVFERLSKVKHLIFDKTGTLTKGECCVREHLLLLDEFDVWNILYCLEQETVHPVGIAMKSFAERRMNGVKCAAKLELDIEEIPGLGIKGVDQSGRTYAVGKVSWVIQLSDQVLSTRATSWLSSVRHKGLTPVGYLFDGVLVCLLAIGDELHEGVNEFLKDMCMKGYEFSLLSGDEESAVNHLVRELGVNLKNVIFDCQPEEKAGCVVQWNSCGDTAMIGDGVNDAIALSAAGVGIAVRGQVESCLKVADIFVPSGRIDLLKSCFDLSDRTILVVKRNIVLSLLYNSVGASMAIFGLVTPLVAAILMPLSSLTVILSSSVGVWRNKSASD